MKMGSIFPKEYVEVECIESIQPIGAMYVAVIDHKTLQYISKTDVRRLKKGNDKRDIEEYAGIQRELSKSREREIGNYVNLVDASFPNSIILSLSSEHATYNPNTKKLSILKDQNVAKVLDGQHRIAGLKHFDDNNGSLKFECIVTIYLDMDLEDQALIFATINKEQKSVSQSLVADLYAFAKSRSPQKTCHVIARTLNFKKGSPFYGKIKILGVASESEKKNASITQATFVKSIIECISKEPQKDRDFYRRNKDNPNAKAPYANQKEEDKYFLRRFFIDDDSDYNIAQTIWNYFYAIQNRWPDAWNPVRPNNILNKSTGYVALMRFFKDAFHHIAKYDEIPTKDDFVKIFNKIDIEESEFTTEKYLPGSKGQSALYNDLKRLSGI